MSDISGSAKYSYWSNERYRRWLALTDHRCPECNTIRSMTIPPVAGGCAQSRALHEAWQEAKMLATSEYFLLGTDRLP